MLSWEKQPSWLFQGTDRNKPELSKATSVFIPCDFHTHKNVFGSTPHVFKNPSETVGQHVRRMTAPMWRWEGLHKGKCFPLHSCSIGNLSWAHCLTPKSVKALAPCSSHFLRKVQLDDTWAEVSGFRGNGERIGGGRWAPLNTTEEVDLARLSGAINTAQATGGVLGVRPHNTTVTCLCS